MERDIIQNWSSERKISITVETKNRFILFGDLIYKTNQKFNVTGLKTTGEIISELIIKSIDPVCDIIVPRGTRFIDLGSGAGIPGIVLAIYFKNFSGVLIESNQKKAGFLKSAINELELTGLEVVCERAELLTRMTEYREAFDWCFARAFGKLFITIELGAPFIKTGGCLYVYSNEKPENMTEKMLVHAGRTGLCIMSHREQADLGLSGKGLCFKKERNIQDQYPRKFAMIKREAEKV